MTIFDYRYAELDFDYDSDRIYQEALANIQAFKPSPAPKIQNPNIWSIESQQLMEQVETVDLTAENWTSGKIASWRAVSLTEIVDIRHSQLAPNSLRNTRQYKWQWRSDLDFGYTRSVVEQLCFKELDSVRVMLLPAGGIGPVHCDDLLEQYYKKGCVSVSLNVKNGGQAFVFRNGDSEHTVVDQRAFLFRDDCWHGVGQCTSNRLQIRINGVPTVETIEKMVKPGTEVWAWGLYTAQKKLL